MPRVRSSLTASEFLTMRHALGLSQVQAGKLLGYTDRTVKRWEAGQPIPEHVCIMMRLMRGNRATALALGAKPPPSASMKSSKPQACRSTTTQPTSTR
jgi:DNA-binding XRE family transcriptional regulator